MIRTKTAVVIGASAAVEIELPGQREMLNRIAQGYDFQRLGTELQSREMQEFDTLFSKVKGKNAELREAALRIRAGSRLSSSMHALLQQHGDDKHVLAAGKLAIAYYTLRSEEHSPMSAEPRDPGDMPLRGTENWLYELSRMVVDGVTRAKAEHCFEHLHIINFNADRSIEHYMPWALHLGFGMSLTEAQAICAEKLRVVHPYGRAGKLVWQAGDEAVAGWGEVELKNLLKQAEGIRTASEFLADRHMRAALYGGLASARRLVFLGFDFNALDTALLFDERLTQSPDALLSIPVGGGHRKESISRVLKSVGGIQAESIVALHDGRVWQMLRDHALFLES